MRLDPIAPTLAWARRWWSGLDDLFFPAICPVCGHDRFDRRADHEPGIALREQAVHAACLAEFRLRARVELRSARWSEGVPIHALLDDNPAWFRLLHRAKYGGEHGLLRPCARWLARAVMAGGGVDGDVVLVPVPDDPRRRRERGFSPVGILADELGAVLGVDVRTDLLRRPRPAPSQTSLRDDAARAANLQGVVRTGDLASVARDRILVLIEDQVTSGATVTACARRLGARGHRLAVLALARAARTPDRVQP